MVGIAIGGPSEITFLQWYVKLCIHDISSICGDLATCKIEHGTSWKSGKTKISRKKKKIATLEAGHISTLFYGLYWKEQPFFSVKHEVVSSTKDDQMLH